MQANRCLINVCPNIIAVRKHQAGSMVRIPQWPKELFNAKYVLVGSLAAANGTYSSWSVTVALSMCTSCLTHPDAICGIVETKIKVQMLSSYFLVRVINRAHESKNKPKFDYCGRRTEATSKLIHVNLMYLVCLHKSASVLQRF